MIENTDKATLDAFARKAVDKKVSLVATDEAAGYADLKPDYPHESVNHSQHEYMPVWFTFPALILSGRS
jgi:hypothetical protein